MKTADSAVRCTLLLALGIVLATPVGAQDWKQIPIPPLPGFHPQQPKRIELPNGLVIFLQEDHELPLIDGIARIRGGSRAEPAAKIGLVSLYGEVWRTVWTDTRAAGSIAPVRSRYSDQDGDYGGPRRAAGGARGDIQGSS